jgi:hypothetical protein
MSPSLKRVEALKPVMFGVADEVRLAALAGPDGVVHVRLAAGNVEARTRLVALRRSGVPLRKWKLPSGLSRGKGRSEIRRRGCRNIPR